MTHPLHSPACIPQRFAGDPYPAFRELRGADPGCWNSDAGFWALLKYEDIRFVSTNPALFSSAKGVTIPTRHYRTRCSRATCSTPTHLSIDNRASWSTPASPAAK